MKIDRRHLLKFIGGSALGTALSPLPWKAIDDVSIWTQNWSWIPVPARGETVIRHTTCALCPAGCGVKVRCIGAQPVGLSGLPGHPTSGGFLCPGGLLGHHFPYDPQRVTGSVSLTGPERREQRLSADQVANSLGQALAGLKANPSAGRLAIIDTLPGRSTSVVYRRLVSQFPAGAYIVPAEPVKRSLQVFEGIAGADYPELGIDLERTRTVLSFGADVFEAWGTPGRFLHRIQSSEGGLRVTQIEPRYSNTAALADGWLPVRPGTEPILALGLASVIVNDRLFDRALSPALDALNQNPEFRQLREALTPVRAAEICGISPEAVMKTARDVAAHPPCLALLGPSCGTGPFTEDDSLAVNFLNLLAGAVGGAGGLVPRRRMPEIEAATGDLVSPTDLSEVPDESVAFLVIDATVPRRSIPTGLIRRKLIKDKAVVVSLASVGAPYKDISSYLVPVPMYLESFAEIPTAPDSPVASCSFSVPLVSAPAEAVSPVEWVNRLAQAAHLNWTPLASDALADSRIKAIWDCRRGSVYSYAEASTKSSSDFASSEELANAFKAGACWLDSPADHVQPKLTASAYFRPETWGRLLRVVSQPIKAGAGRTGDTVVLLPYGTTFLAAASPLADKLTRESDLYARPGDALLSPSTASRLGVQEGQKAVLETAKGRLPVRIRLEETALPGVVFVPIPEAGASSPHPDPRDFCDAGADGVWRGTPAKLRRLDV